MVSWLFGCSFGGYIFYAYFFSRKKRRPWIQKLIAQKFALNIVIVLFSGLKFYLPNAQCFFVLVDKWEASIGNWYAFTDCYFCNVYTYVYVSVCACVYDMPIVYVYKVHIKSSLNSMRCTLCVNCNKGKHCFVYIRCLNDMIVSNGEIVREHKNVWTG